MAINLDLKEFAQELKSINLKEYFANHPSNDEYKEVAQWLADSIDDDFFTKQSESKSS